MQHKLPVISFYRSRDVEMPERATPQAAGMDVFVPNDAEPITIAPGKAKLINTGLYVKFDDGYVLMGCNRSGMAHKRCLVLGAHVIDSDYQGEIFIDLHNIGTEPQTLYAGDKIAQLVLLPYAIAAINDVESKELLYRGVESERGDGALGSSDKKNA